MPSSDIHLETQHVTDILYKFLTTLPSQSGDHSIFGVIKVKAERDGNLSLFG